MLEPRRSRYLRALGVDIYVPRHVLPGASPSPVCEWEEVVPPQAAADLVVATAPDAAPIPIPASVPAGEPAPVAAREVPADLTKLAGELQGPGARRATADKSADDKPAAVSSSAKPVADAVPIPKIALGIAVGAGGILVVDDAPANVGERNDYQRLLGNLLFALRSEGAPTLDVFVWPMSKQPQLDRSASAARETLAAHLQSLSQRHAVHTVLLLGEAAQQWCVVDGDHLRRVASVSALGCLRQPALKRQLWNDIRHLAAVH